MTHYNTFLLTPGTLYAKISGMYIKKVTKTNGRSKKKYDYLHLVESVRTENGPRQRLVLNLGKLEIDPSLYKSLARRIEDILTGQKSLMDLPLELEKIARNKASQIFDKRAEEVKETESTNFRNIDLNSIEASESRSFGGEYLCDSIWNELDMNKFLKRMDIPENTIPILESLVIGRLVDPGSERYTKDWVENRSSLYELTGNPLRPSLSSFYRGGDSLFGIKNELEKHLAKKEKSLFSLNESLFFFDLTNSYFEGEARGNPKAQYGRSKEKRSDCKLVTMGMIIDELGFAKYSEMFPGNQSEAATLSEMVKAMEANFSGSTDKTIVMDAGVATEDNIKWLKENEYFYLVVSRKKKREIPPGVQMVPIKTRNTPVQAGILNNEETDEIELYCHSEGKEKKEEQIKTFFQERFEEELKKVNISLSKKNGIKRLDKVIERIGRLKERFKRVAYHYDVSIKKDLETNKAVDISWHLKEREKTEGVYVLRTNRKELKEEQIWNIHNMLTDIEDAFRCMKSELGMRPIYHKKEERGDGHIFITVLAYHILHFVRMKLRQNEIYLSWSTIREGLSTHARITTTFKRKDGKMVHIRKSSTANLFHKKIYSALNISCQPGKTLKTIL